jgi:hypothetical protein
MAEKNVVLTQMQILTPMKKIFTYLSLLFAAAALIVSAGSCNKGNEAYTGPDVGTGGSLARFTITLNHLYVVDSRKLYTFSLYDPANPVKVFTNEIGFDVETIFTWKDKLFIGSRDAMYVYSVANPGEPSLLGTANHVRACDPVVANDSIAYVTVRTGSNCGGNNNALLVYDLKNVLQPVQKNVINLQNPHGLGIQDNTLFVCDEKYGLKVYDISMPYTPIQKAKITGETFYDCIPYENILICMINGGIAIYDITDRDNITLLSKITE